VHATILSEEGNEKVQDMRISINVRCSSIFVNRSCVVIKLINIHKPVIV
jgi:hypothetical protein